MREELSSVAGFSAGVLADEAELPVRRPTTPSTAPAPATMNDTVETVAIDLAELMSPYSVGPHSVCCWQPVELLMVFVFDSDSTPVMVPTMTPAPARPKPPNINTFDPADLPPVTCASGSGVVSPALVPLSVVVAAPVV